MKLARRAAIGIVTWVVLLPSANNFNDVSSRSTRGGIHTDTIHNYYIAKQAICGAFSYSTCVFSNTVMSFKAKRSSYVSSSHSNCNNLTIFNGDIGFCIAQSNCTQCAVIARTEPCVDYCSFSIKTSIQSIIYYDYYPHVIS